MFLAARRQPYSRMASHDSGHFEERACMELIKERPLLLLYAQLHSLTRQYYRSPFRTMLFQKEMPEDFVVSLLDAIVYRS